VRGGRHVPSAEHQPGDPARGGGVGLVCPVQVAGIVGVKGGGEGRRRAGLLRGVLLRLVAAVGDGHEAFLYVLGLQVVDPLSCLQEFCALVGGGCYVCGWDESKRAMGRFSMCVAFLDCNALADVGYQGCLEVNDYIYRRGVSRLPGG